MLRSKNVDVVIPAFRCQKQIERVLKTLPSFIDMVWVVDDACPDNTGAFVESLQMPKVQVLYNEKNLGVGGAVLAGYRAAIKNGTDVIVKIDGDGQMDPSFVEKLIEPILENSGDYTKGNRFRDFSTLKKMPPLRLIGNSILSFLIKFSTGYWSLMDPTNGFTAICRKAAVDLNFSKISTRYFFESDLLIFLNINRARVVDVSMPTIYGDEVSNLKIRKVIFQFPFHMAVGLLRRIYFSYFIYNFNMGSVYLLVGIPMVLWGLFFGLYHWLNNWAQDVTTPVGTVMFAVLPLILGTQFLLQAINIDIQSEPHLNRGNGN